MMKADISHLKALRTAVYIDLYWFGSRQSFEGKRDADFRIYATRLYNNLHAFKVAVAAEDTLEAIIQFTN